MSLYKFDKLISEARRLAKDYREATGKPLAGVSAEIALHDAAHLLDLELCEQPQAGYDAIGRGRREGLKVQIKGRAILDESKSGQRIGQLKTEQDWDLVVLVLFDADFEPVEIYEADRAEMLSSINNDSRRNKRGAMSVAKFKIIGRLVWTREDGVEEDVWDNRSGD